MARKRFSARAKRIERMRRASTPSVGLRDVRETSTQIESPEPIFAPAVLCDTEIIQDGITSRLSELIHDWLRVYTFHKSAHESILRSLVSSNILYVAHDGDAETIIPGDFAMLGVLDESTRQSLCEHISRTLDAVTPSTLIPLVGAEVVNAGDSQLIEAQVGELGRIKLKFKNMGSNSIPSIETYLQEKLDVLDYLQTDKQRAATAGNTPLISSSPIIATIKSRSPVVAPVVPLSAPATVQPDSNISDVSEILSLDAKKLHALADRDRNWETASNRSNSNDSVRKSTTKPRSRKSRFAQLYAGAENTPRSEKTPWFS